MEVNNIVKKKSQQNFGIDKILKSGYSRESMILKPNY